MQVASTKCPAGKKIEMLATDALQEAEAEKTERHISICPMCRAQYEASQSAVQVAQAF
jgi:hypothetical protein